MTDLAIPEPGSALGLLGDPKLYMEQTLGRAIMWLAEVEKVEEVIASKALASAYETFIREKELGHDAQLAATEIIRRCERRIGQLVRKGQEDGEVRVKGQSFPSSPGRGDEGRPRTLREVLGMEKQKDAEHAIEAVAPLTDGVSDEQFEEAITEAKAEANLSRANVVRKVKGDTRPPGVIPMMKEKQRADAIGQLAAQNFTSNQIGKQLGVSPDYIRREARRLAIDIPADKVLGKTRRIDPNRVVSETVSTLEGVAFSLGLLGDDLTDLDVEQVAYWVASLSDSIRPINRLIKALKEINP